MTTYDEWKTTNPADHEGYGECDCCGRGGRVITQCFVGGLETWACDECRGGDPDAEYERRRDDKLWDNEP